MLQQQFMDAIDVLNHLTMDDLAMAGVIQHGDSGAWVDYTRAPHRWVGRLSPARAEKMWALIQSKMPPRDVSEESADALHDIVLLAQEFGWRGDSSLWRWLKDRLTSYARLDQRVVELLEANNDYLQQARDARKEAASWQTDCEMYANAWKRELGTIINKRHLIDALIVTTQHLVERARVADHLQRVAAGKRKGIYIASKVRHAVTWKTLRAAGLPVISTWIDEAGIGGCNDPADLWRRCLAEASTAEVLIVYRVDDEALNEEWVEVGAALACGVPVYAVGIEEFTVANAAGITHFHNLDAAIEAARVKAAEAKAA